MKTLTLTFIALLASMIAHAQVTPDTTNIVLGDKKIIVIDSSPNKDTLDVDVEDEDDHSDGDKETLTHWGGIDVGVNMLLSRSGTTTMDTTAQWLELDYSR